MGRHGSRCGMDAWWVPPTLRHYQGSWLSADALAGLTLVAVALPSQLATARLAGLPAVTGLYAFVAGSVLYAMLGSNRHLSVGADSTIAPVLATAAATVAATGTARYDSTMSLTALAVGASLIVVGILRLGWIADFLSTPVIAGVLAGIAVEIVVRQIPVILGLPGGGTTSLGRIRQVADQISHTNGWTAAVSMGVFAVMVASRRIDRRFPGALVGLIGSIIAVDALGLGARHAVATLGALHGGLPEIHLPSASWSQLTALATTVLTVTFVCVAQTAATVRDSGTSALPVDGFNRDLIGIGAGSVAAGLVGAFAVDASPPNTAIVSASGSRSQLASLVAAMVVLVGVLTATGLLANLPQATLGATLVFVAGRLFRVGQLRNVARFDRLEFALAAATLLVVALVGVEQGVALAMILSLADRTRRSARPRDAVLGREPGTDHWIPVDIGYQTEQVRGVLVYLVYAPLWYGNADYIRLRVHALVDAAPTPPAAVILDANAMSDIDFTGLAALRELAAELRDDGITLAIARASHLVHHNLRHGALLEDLHPHQVFVSIEEAVAELAPST